jgi:ferredoxin
MKAKWVPVVAADKCTGCGRCVEVCGVKCLEIAEGIAALPPPGRLRKRRALHHRMPRRCYLHGVGDHGGKRSGWRLALSQRLVLRSLESL